MDETKDRQLKVFLCYAHSDAAQVRALYTRLKADGIAVWWDEESLIPGANWELEICKAVREADIVVVCLSKQFNKAGFRHKEVRLALDTAMEQPEDEIFIIPARLDKCDYLESLRPYHGVDLFEPDGYARLMRALQVRAQKIGAVLESHKGLFSKITAPRPKLVTTKRPEPELKPTAQKAGPVARKKPEPRKWNTQITILVIVTLILFAAMLLIFGKDWFRPTSTPTPTTLVTATPKSNNGVSWKDWFVSTPTPIPTALVTATPISSNISIDFPGESIYVRSSPDLHPDNSNIVGWVAPGDKVIVTGWTNAPWVWCQINIPDRKLKDVWISGSIQIGDKVYKALNIDYSDLPQSLYITFRKEP